MNYLIKKLDFNEIESYIRVNRQAWLETYKGIVNDEFLELINTEEEISKSVKRMEDKYDENQVDEYIVYYNNKPVGDFSVHESRIEELPNIGELKSIYLLDEVHGKGLGKIIFNYAINLLKERGFKEIAIACLKENPTNNFYKHLGAEFKFERIINIAGHELEENVYVLKI